MNVREIAKLANVSIATVSRVINRPEVVLPETREQVLAVMRKVGYSPAPHAGGGAQPKAVGLLVPDAEDYLAIRLMAGIESVAARREHAVYLCSTKGGPDRERQAIAGALEQRMRGLVIYTNTLSAEDAADLQRRRVPFVLVGRSEAAPRHNACYINYEEGGYRMVRHLLELGHQKFLLLCEAGSPNIEARMWEGLCRARRELMTGPGGDRVLHAEGGSIRAGYDAARERQGMAEARIKYIESRLALYQVVDLDKLSGDKVIFGSTVEVEDVDSGESRNFTILGPDEADPSKGSISFLSPVGQALLGKEEGDEVTVEIPRGRVTYEVVSIAFNGSKVLG